MTQPFKCPACNGSKRIDSPQTGQLTSCPTCSGTGVVWAPPGVTEAEQASSGDVLDLTYRGSE